VPRCEGCQAFTSKEPPITKITTIGLDLAKSIFQVHGVDATGQVVVRKSLRRAQMLPFFPKLPSCLVGIEACGTSHHWARELIKLGHEVRLMPPAYVKPYVKRGKTDAADAEAVCEAVRRPTMRFVPVKSPEQQAALSMHRTRDLLVKQRTQMVNMIRGLLAGSPPADRGRIIDSLRSQLETRVFAMAQILRFISPDQSFDPETSAILGKANDLAIANLHGGGNPKRCAESWPAAS